jgi:hypothetical protein
MKAVAIFVLLLLALVVAPPATFAQSLNGAIFQAEGEDPLYFMFSVSGPSFVVAMLSFGGGGNGRWFAAFGATDGVSGAGQVISPAGFALTTPAGMSMQFQLDEADASTGSFTTTGMQNLLFVTSGRFVRIFP